MIEAQERADNEAIAKISKALETRIKTEAKNIYEKYIDPPNTTDIAILFLGTESLYAEILRRPGLVEYLQQEYHVIVAGPTTIAALLNIIQKGFQAFSLQQKISQVWKLITSTKMEFQRLEETLQKMEKKTNDIQELILQAVKETKRIHRNISELEELPSETSYQQLPYEQQKD